MLVTESDDEGSEQSKGFPAHKKKKAKIIIPGSRPPHGVEEELHHVEEFTKQALETQRRIRGHLSRVMDHSLQLSHLFEQGSKELRALDRQVKSLRRAIEKK